MASLWPGANLRATGVKSAPEPDPTPAPEPDPTPAPEPDPTPAPEPDPTPAPEPDPTPAPKPPAPNATWFQGTDVNHRLPVYRSGDRRQVDPNAIWASQPSVRKVVEWRCRLLASVSYHLYERLDDDNRQRVTDHPIARLLARPSARKTAYDFFYTFAVDHHMYDQAIAVLAYDQGRHVLKMLPPATTRVDYEHREPVSLTTAAKSGPRVTLDAALAVITHGYLDDAGRQTSPMETLADLLDEMQATTEYRRSVFANGARINAILERPPGAPKWNGTTRDRFAASWAAFSRGGGREGGTPILEDGMRLVAVDAFKPIDTGDLESRRLTDAQVASAYFTPPELVGAGPGHFASVDAWRQTIYGPVLGPDLVRMEQALTGTLVPLLGGGRDLYIEADVKAKMRGSFLEQAEAMSTAVGAPWLTRDEARALENRPSIPGGDQLVTPLNVLIGDLPTPRDTAPQR